MRQINSRLFLFILAVSAAWGRPISSPPVITSVQGSYYGNLNPEAIAGPTSRLATSPRLRLPMPTGIVGTSVTAGVERLLLTVTGTNFAINFNLDTEEPQSQFEWVPSGGCPIDTCLFTVTPVSQTQFTVQVPNEFIAYPDPGAAVAVVNPGNIASDPFPFPINPRVTNTAMPQAYLNVPYAAYITTGGTPVYTVNPPFAGGVPGLSPVGSAIGGGIVMGTPTYLGTSSGAAMVLDAWSQTAPSRDYTVNVALLPGGEVGVPYATQSPFAGVGPYIFVITSGRLPPGISLILANQTLSIVGTPTATGSYTATVEAESPIGAIVTTGSISIDVYPQAVIYTSSLGAMPATGSFSVQLGAQGGMMPYTWSVSSGSLPTGLTLNQSTGVISGTPTGKGAAFTIKVTDLAGIFSTRSYTLDYALQLTPSTLPAGQVGTNYVQGLSVSGGSGSYTCSLGQGAPAWIGMYAPCQVIGPPVAGSFTFNVQVADQLDGQTLTQQYTVAINPPGLTVTASSPLADTPMGATISIPLAAAGGTPPYKWSVTGGSLPSGASLSAAGVLTGAATAQGVFTFTATVTDSAGATASKSLGIKILPSLLTVTTTALPNGFGQTAYSATVIATGGVPPYRWSANGLPPALTIDSATGAISGTPGPQGNFPLTVTVTDSVGTTNTTTLTIKVTVAPLQITSLALASAMATVAYTGRLAASGGVLPYTWMPVGQTPAGFVVLSNGTVSGTYPQFAVLSFPVRVVDGQGNTAAAMVGLKIDPAPLAIGQTTLPSGTAGMAYTQPMSATGGVPPFTWTASLPAGLAINPNTGAITGASLVGGPQTLVVTVTDITGISTANTYPVTFAMLPLPGVSFGPVTAAPAAQPKLVFSLASLYPLAITGTAAMTLKPDGSVGDPSVVFASGKNTLPFTIPVGLGSGTFSTGANRFQTGTVVGTITITLSLQAGGLDITPSPAPVFQIRIAPQAPVITGMTAVRDGGFLDVTVQGFSDTREVQQAFFVLGIAPGGSVTPTSFTLPLSSVFASYYQSSASATTGGQFLLSQQFVVMGNVNQIQSVSGTLTNSVGGSSSFTVQAQ